MIIDLPRVYLMASHPQLQTGEHKSSPVGLEFSYCPALCGYTCNFVLVQLLHMRTVSHSRGPRPRPAGPARGPGHVK